MRKILLLVVVLIIALSAYTQKKNVITSRWVKNPIVADGEIADWVIKPPFYDSFTKINYEVANDSNNLYLCFYISDIKSQTQVLDGGLKISLKSNSKRGRKAMITFPLIENWEFDLNENVNYAFSNYNQNYLYPTYNQMKNGMKQMQTSMKLHGFYKTNGVFPLDLEGGVNVSIGWNLRNDMIYEVVIPFEKLLGEKIKKVQLNEIMTLKVEIIKSGRPEDLPKVVIFPAFWYATYALSSRSFEQQFIPVFI